MTFRTKDIAIYKSGYKLVKLVTELTRHYPRDFRPTLGKMIQEEAVSLILYVYKANAARDKLDHIDSILEKLLVVEMLMQMSFDLHLINQQGYTDTIEITGNIGAQAGGWRKPYVRSSHAKSI